MMQKGADLAKGPIVTTLIRLSVPLMLSGLLQSLYGIVDMIVVGNAAGGVGLSAVSMGSQVMQAVTAFSIGMSTGGSVLISQNVGRASERELRRLMGTLTTLFLIVSVLLTVLVAGIFPRAILRIFQTPEPAMEHAVSYLRICGGGIILIFAYNMVSAVLRGMGNTAVSLYMALASAALNVVLDLVFAFCFGMGAAGVALATVLAQGVAAVSMIVYLLKTGSFLIPRRREELHMDRDYLAMLLRVGIPAGAQAGVVFVSMLIVAGMVNGYGLTVSAAYGACMKVDSLSTLPRQAVAQSAAAMVGQSFGASDHRRTSRTVLAAAAVNFVVCGVVAVLVWIFAPALVRIFDTDAAVIVEGCRYLRINAWGYPIVGLMGAFNALTIGIGFTTFTLVNSAIDSLLARLLFCGLFAGFMGLDGVYLGLVLAPLCAALLGGGYFLLGTWRKRAVLTTHKESE